jgi:hypothetical protein
MRKVVAIRGTPIIESRTAIRRRNAELRARECLAPAEVKKLIEAAHKRGRYGHWDAA